MIYLKDKCTRNQKLLAKWANVRRMAISLCLCLVISAVGLVPSDADAQPYWSDAFSEEDSQYSRNQGTCLGGIIGMKCFGSRCDSMKLLCEQTNPIVTDPPQQFNSVISEESPNNRTTCRPGEIVVALNCEGSYCDNVGVKCARTDYSLSHCGWSKWFSEEDSALSFGNSRYLTGLECSGGNCDNKRAWVCSGHKPDPVVARPGTAFGQWEVACSGGNTCANQLKQGVDLGTIDEETWAKETGKSVSVSVGAHVGYTPPSAAGGVGGGVSYNVTGELSAKSSSATTLVNSTTKSYNSFCETSVNLQENKYGAVFQWVVKQPVKDTVVTIRTCQVTCTQNSNTYPEGPPGHAGIDTRCNSVNRQNG